MLFIHERQLKNMRAASGGKNVHFYRVRVVGEGIFQARVCNNKEAIIKQLKTFEVPKVVEHMSTGRQFQWQQDVPVHNRLDMLMLNSISMKHCAAV
jgi:hypothetical protein